jgi:hypothetical protein
LGGRRSTRVTREKRRYALGDKLFELLYLMTDEEGKRGRVERDIYLIPGHRESDFLPGPLNTVQLAPGKKWFLTPWR